MRRKVAFLDYSPIFAGAETVLFNMISHIDRSRYEPILIFPYPMNHQSRYDALDCEKVYLADGLKWWMGSDRWKRPLRGSDLLKRAIFGHRIAEIIKKKEIDILDVNLMRVDVKMWVKSTRKHTGAKIVGHYRSQEQKWVAPADAQQLFDVVACVSEYSKMRFRMKGVFTESRVLYDSVNVDMMKCDTPRSEIRKRLGYDDETILLTSVGQLSPHKGHDNAIRAFSMISRDYPNARLLIAGGGNVDMVDYYKSIANECGVGDKVNIPGVQLGNIQEIYKATDLTLSLTKVGEGFGLVPYESSLLGTPFIAPCFGAVCEFVTDGENGLLVDTNNVDAIVEKIRYALDNAVETKAMTERLNTIIYDRLHPKVLANNLVCLYDTLFDNAEVDS